MDSVDESNELFQSTIDKRLFGHVNNQDDSIRRMTSYEKHSHGKDDFLDRFLEDS